MASTTSDDLVQLSVGTIRFGELIRDDTGQEMLAPADAVVLTTLINGDIAHSVQIEPESAMLVATAMAQAGGKLIGDQVDNNGKKVGLLGYIKTMAKKTPPTPPPGTHNHPDHENIRPVGSACQACESYWAAQGIRL